MRSKKVVFGGILLLAVTVPCLIAVGVAMSGDAHYSDQEWATYHKTRNDALRQLTKGQNTQSTPIEKKP